MNDSPTTFERHWSILASELVLSEICVYVDVPMTTDWLPKTAEAGELSLQPMHGQLEKYLQLGEPPRSSISFPSSVLEVDTR